MSKCQMDFSKKRICNLDIGRRRDGRRDAFKFCKENCKRFQNVLEKHSLFVLCNPGIFYYFLLTLQSLCVLCSSVLMSVKKSFLTVSLSSCLASCLCLY